MAGAGVNQGEWLYQVAAGLIHKHSCLRKFGYNPDLTLIDVVEDVWDYGGTYTYTGSTAVDYYVSSSNNGDTQSFRFYGLGEDKTLQEIVCSLTGQTKKKLVSAGGTEKWYRIWRVMNEGSTNLAGNLYVYEDDTVVAGIPQTSSKIRAFINDGNNQTLMAMYTIPSGKTGYNLACRASCAARKDQHITVRFWVRPYGQVWQLKRIFVLDSGGSSDVACKFDAKDKIPALADIRADAISDVANAALSAEFEILLVDD